MTRVTAHTNPAPDARLRFPTATARAFPIPAATPSETGAVAIEFVADTPETLKPGALAFALPYEGVHIRIFWDRIQTWQLLAHVIVHEVTHILQGKDQHSGEGIMKAQWTAYDRSHEGQAIQFHPGRRGHDL